MQAWNSILRGIGRDFKSSWRELLVTHVMYNVVAFILLTPLVTLALQLFVSLSGSAALTDADIALFALRPVGLLGLILVGALFATIVALEHAALMAIGFAVIHARPINSYDALGFALRCAWPVVRVAARVIARMLLLMTPFLGAGCLVFLSFLRQHDINYYLHEKPPAFWTAAVLIGGLAAVMVLLVIGAFVRWVFALPLLLFSGVPVKSALQASVEMTRGRRRLIAVMLVGWLVASAASGAAATWIVREIGVSVISKVAGSLSLMVLVVGVILLLGGLVNFLVAFFNTSTLSLLVVRLFRDASLGDQSDFLAADCSEPEVGLRNWKRSRRVLLWGILGLTLVAVCVGFVALVGLQLDDKTEVIAHRGASAVAPENTLAAVEQAIVDGADWVEIDVQETADGEVVVVHDSDLKKTAGVDLKISNSTYEQLRSVDIGSWFAPDFSDQRVPRLRDVLEICKGRARVNIELKYYGREERLEERVVNVVEKTGMSADVVVMSLDYNGLQRVRALRPAWRIGLLSSVSVGDFTKLDVDFLALNARFASPWLVKRAQQSGKDVLVWTVNDAIGMSTMMSRGVDGIITDEPALAVSVLEQRARLSTPERLLLETVTLFGRSPEYNDQ